MWRFKGSPYYLDQQAKRLGITQVLADRARNNTEIYRLSVLLAQLAGRYHAARRENGEPVFYVTERAQIKGTLEQCELDLQKLHMLAAAADAMLSEAWEAFGFPEPDRIFEVHSLPDTPLFPLGDGTVGVPDEQTEVFAQSL
jgi:hypothetical protein